MSLTPSVMVPLGTPAPVFTLPDTDGSLVSLNQFKNSRAMLVMFICNHCPYVKHIRDQLARVCNGFVEQGVGVVAINSNDVVNYPADAPAEMKKEKIAAKYTFPYLFDESQEVARAYHAACTPDFFLYGADMELVYRGQFDKSRPGSPDEVTGECLKKALTNYLEGNPPQGDQHPSAGCNIKWKPGAVPEYLTN